ncbi:MAG: rod shape-determining protein MreD [Candidatus Eremiobacteraeota bacterium]|nr:rod shape-determining protein MreD [Candidatus Eremiobacteraeota bacterium]
MVPARDALERLRPEGAQQRSRVRPEEAEVSVAPHFWVLLVLAVAAIVMQSTLLRPLSLREAHLSLVTILLVWTGLRCGISAGGILGLAAGLIEDALGGGGANVLATTLVGFCAGLLNVRFFADSLPIFVSAVAGATILRGIVTYLMLEVGFGLRGTFHRVSHELAWQVVLNCLVAAIVLLVLRAFSHARR